MKKLIGFATKYYTLWSVEDKPVYIQDSYGNYHISRVDRCYTYHKNVSKSLDKVKEQYPTLAIDEGLRGLSRSFVVPGSDQRPDHIFWKGKYQGMEIAKVAEDDWNYVLWALDANMGNHSDFIKQLPQYKVHLAEIQTKLQQEMAEEDRIRNLIPIGKPIELFATSNGFNVLESDCGKPIQCEFNADIAGEDNLRVRVIVSNFARVGGLYPYIMPMVNGTIQRTKNKKFTVTPTGVRVYKLYKYQNNSVSIWIDPLTSEYGPTIIH